MSELTLASSGLMKNHRVWLMKYISSANINSCFVPFNRENLKNCYAVDMQRACSAEKYFKSEGFMCTKRLDGEDFLHVSLWMAFYPEHMMKLLEIFM